jgi:hypothetical protein
MAVFDPIADHLFGEVLLAPEKFRALTVQVFGELGSLFHPMLQKGEALFTRPTQEGFEKRPILFTNFGQTVGPKDAGHPMGVMPCRPPFA